MSTDKYLENLDLEQLYYAAEKIRILITNKTEEKKLLIWRVGDRGIVYANFAEDKYVEAAEFLLKKAKELKAEGYPEELEIDSLKIPKSEYSDFINNSGIIGE